MSSVTLSKTWIVVCWFICRHATEKILSSLPSSSASKESLTTTRYLSTRIVTRRHITGSSSSIVGDPYSTSRDTGMSTDLSSYSPYPILSSHIIIVNLYFMQVGALIWPFNSRPKSSVYNQNSTPK
ncbi:hypothetical protein BO70DRAFT_215101 [Aspergillus heteromorphus CBS 117.55]|uniref:Uncharacterized protein n=1 Tax=Aspergillus heteromorphus CBS 117.55 TaxID=1448321 RepID=A0A317WMN2_9EURO|nr:uncharacterized protein BO70DRAFT_215101 [Aspergillus heteromorphus CBS 117.55]PWY86981.1 hypothetical protein BO70DRAFT_215101 [Aspergillus heteromorphus CBS 117.55]